MVSMPAKDPIAAHETYVSKLGYVSIEFNPEASLAVVVSPEQQDGTAILLEPFEGTFAEVVPLIWTKCVAKFSNWATTTLGFIESWRAPAEGEPVEQAELRCINPGIGLPNECAFLDLCVRANNL